MNTRFQTTVGRLLARLLAVGMVGWIVPAAHAQPSLGLHFSAGKPTLILTGAVDAVYLIQIADGLSPTTNAWANRTLVQVKGVNATWTDPAPATGQRFYRAVTIPPPTDPNLVFIPPGTFTMGSAANETGRDADEGPQTTVLISRGFWMGKYEVTQAEFLAVTGSNPSGFTGNLSRPVDNIAWTDATNYCALLTQLDRAAGRIPTNMAYRLPTEAEWEYVCRAGTQTRFSYGNDPGYAQLVDYAWFLDNGVNATHAVGQKIPNPWGLYDIHGNVWEWCQDRVGAYAGGTVIDPQGPATGTSRILRGGGWPSDRGCRAANRASHAIGDKATDFGFRVVLALGQP